MLFGRVEHVERVEEGGKCGLGKPWFFMFYLFSMAKNVQAPPRRGEIRHHICPI